MPNYRKFMLNAENKAALAAFVSEYFVLKGPSILVDGQIIVLAGGFKVGQMVKKVTKASVTNLTELFSSQEEADTRMLLHAVHLSSSHQHIIIRCDDTDVLVRLLYYESTELLDSSVTMYAGHITQFRDRRGYIPICKIVTKIGKDLCLNLPAAHAITGSDTTSSFFQIGKRTAYSKLAEAVKSEPNVLKTFGHSDNITEEVSSAQTYILKLYSNKKTQCTNLDKLRYTLASTTDRSVAKLPPTEDTFIQHVKRARYQVSIWCQSHVQKPILWNPVGNGWKASDNGLVPVMHTKPIAPVQVRDLTHMYCTDSGCRENRNCQCRQSGLQCTEMCLCHCDDCQNCAIPSDSESSESSGDEFDS